MTSALENKTAGKKKLTDRITSLKKQSDAAKKAAKSAKADLKGAKQKFKDAKRASKKLRKALKALESELISVTARKNGRKPAAKKPSTKRVEATEQPPGKSAASVDDAITPPDQVT
jgi:chromosome segregation ATPase